MDWKQKFWIIINSFYRIIFYFSELFLRISCYATASTEESVFIIGGYTKGSPDVTSRIAEYKNGEWIDGGNLAQARYGHGAITSESMTFVIGGTHNDGTNNNGHNMYCIHYRVLTYLWSKWINFAIP